MEELHISVRNLVEFIFREGDIDNRSNALQSADAMLEGTRIHRKIQKSMGPDYLPEVPLKYVVEESEYHLTIDGRADGIFTEDGLVWVDEIKGMYRKVDKMETPIFVHKAQALCYAYIFARQNELEQIGVQLTYCNLDTEEQNHFREIVSYEELEEWFLDLISQYKKWADFEVEWKKKRTESIKGLAFPFEYREGQKKLVSDVYRSIARKKTLFMQAPTGVGKTISTIFPALHAMGEGIANRMFYLTAKTITATPAIETFQLLYEKGLKAKVTQITAKEKMCLCEQTECNPIHCPYASGHYDRVNEAVFELINSQDMFTREQLMEHAKKHQVCPFEMCLDVSLFCDAIICDYNYAFDPNVYLKRFFQSGIKGDYVFLVDEAHNLVDRSRSMYSATLCKEDFLQMKRIIKPYSPWIEKCIEKCNKVLLSYKRECENYVIYENIGNLYFHVLRLTSELDEFLQKPNDFPGRKEVVDFYFTLRNFLNIYDLVDEHYVIYSEIKEDGKFYLKLFCVDPSLNLQDCIDRSVATVLFSATLLPLPYYKRLLVTDENPYAIYAKSSFSSKQSKILIACDVSSKYTRRCDNEYERFAQYIKKTVGCKEGNYMVFFPSYKFLEKVKEKFDAINDDKVETIVQENGMAEQAREEFLNRFHEKTNHSLIGFCVMGGIFGEGIDLKNDSLIGVIIVGTGLPQMNNEQEILKNYYDFDYAFRYPGMNKVLQAAGRVIRTVEDKGIIVLLDERFLQSDYKTLYPREWQNLQICDINSVEEGINDFWSKQ